MNEETASSLLIKAARARELAALCGDARAGAYLIRQAEELEAEAAKLLDPQPKAKPDSTS